MSERHSLWAFIAVLLAILTLAICAAYAIDRGKNSGPYESAIVGLIGVIGTFRPRSSGMSEQSEQKLIDKVPPPTGEAAEQA